MKEAHDAEERRCPQLGHAVSFAYCRAMNRGLPCRKIYDCWFERFDVVSYVREHFSEQQIRAFTAPPPDKRVTIYELIRQARERAARRKDTDS